MSNKKKRNQKAASASTEFVPAQESTIGESPTKQSRHSGKGGKTGLVRFLKSNLWLVGVSCFLALGVFGAGLKYLDEAAQKEIVRRAGQKGTLNNQEQSFLNKINPFLPAANPTTTPLPLSKEYIYAGSRLLAVEDAEASAVLPTDLAIWRPSSGQWWVMAGAGTQQVTQAWGLNGDRPVPGDYDGDGKTDFALWRPSDGVWYIISSGGGGGQVQFGQSGDVPVQADYDGDGKTDLGVYRPSNGGWYVQQSSDAQYLIAGFGLSTDVPAPADYTGDGRADIAVWRNSETRFYLRTGAASYETVLVGASSTQPVSADYDGDGRANYAVRDGANWVIMDGAATQSQIIPWEQATDTAVQNDYDGDGKVDIAIWRGTSSIPGEIGKWYIRNSSNPNNPRVESWGVVGDIPVPAFWKRQ